jgi:hypothetical protein
MSCLAVFGYASLVSAASAAETLGRDVRECPRARVRGRRRRWSTYRDNRAVEKTFARAGSGEIPPFVLGLNLEPADDEDDDGPNGVLIEVSESELDRLDLRELRFRRNDVTNSVEPADGPLDFERVVAYTARPEHFAPEPPAGAVILAPYVRTIERAFTELGPADLDLFRATTDPPPVEVIEAELVRDEIPPGNPRAW